VDLKTARSNSTYPTNRNAGSNGCFTSLAMPARRQRPPYERIKSGREHECGNSVEFLSLSFQTLKEECTEARRGQGLMQVAMHIANALTYCKEYLIILNHKIII